MAGRIRNPSSRALAIAAEASTPAAPPRVRNRKPSASRQKKVAATKNGKGKSKAVDPDLLDEEEETMEDEEEKEPDLTLYCICLGFDTGEQPMIQCSSCSNWFHFRCVNLTEDEASNIEAYCCDICEEMGAGHTLRSTDTSTSRPKPLPASSEDDDDALADPDAEMSLPSSPSVAGSEDDDEMSEDDYGGDRKGGQQRKRGKGSEGRRRKGDAGSEVDEEYVGDEESVLRDRPRKRNRTKAPQPAAKREQRRSASAIESSPPPPPKRSHQRKPAVPAPPLPSSSTASTPATDKTRAHCTKQLASLFQSIFSVSDADANSAGVEVRAAAFAESVEAELFDGFGEVDHKGIKGPRTKYAAKFRSLHFNLKSNAAFRSRISSSSLGPAEIVNMSNEDLLTPELKAMAESVRAASLKHSVKEVLTAPTAKRTHKGEEEIENFAASAAAAEERESEQRELLNRQTRVEKARERSASFSGSMLDSPAPLASPRNELFAFGSPSASMSPSASESPGALSLPFSSSSSRPRSSLPTSNLSITAEDLGLDFADPSSVEHAEQKEAAPSPSTTAAASSFPLTVGSPSGDGAMLPPPPRNRSSFDMASIWAQAKPSPTLPSSEQFESTPMDESGEKATTGARNEDDYDPFVSTSRGGNGGDDEDFEASLLRDEPAVPHLKSAIKPATIPQQSDRSTTPSTQPPPTSSSTTPLSELVPIWAGDVIVPDEGGFPAFGVQIGGRAFGTAPDVWNQLLPRGLTMDGRIPTKVASKYLVECSFASSRELVVVALQADLTGPSEQFPYKPTGPSCRAKHAHVVDFYVKRDRIGVVSPPEQLKKVVKDIYIIPLKTDAPLPEYIELLDEHNVAETGEREQDLLLCVLIIQKGALPTTFFTTGPPISAPAPTPTLPLSTTSFPSASPSPWPTSSQAPLPTSAPFAPHPSSLPAFSQSYSPSTPYSPSPAHAPEQTLQNASTSGLSSLLSNPSLLSSVLTSSTTAVQNLAANPNLLAAIANAPGTAQLLADLMKGGGLPVVGGGRGFSPMQQEQPFQQGYGGSASSRGAGNASPLAGGASPPSRSVGFVHPSRMALVPDVAPAGVGGWSGGRDDGGVAGGGSGWGGGRDDGGAGGGWGGRADGGAGGGRGGWGDGGRGGGYGGGDGSRGRGGGGAGGAGGGYRGGGDRGGRGGFSPSERGSGWGARGGRGRGSGGGGY